MKRPKVRDQLGATLGVSGEIIRQREAVDAAIARDPATFGALRGMSTSAAYHELQRLSGHERPRPAAPAAPIAPPPPAAPSDVAQPPSAVSPEPPPPHREPLPDGATVEDAKIEGRVTGLCRTLCESAKTLRAVRSALTALATAGSHLTGRQLDRLRYELNRVRDAVRELGALDTETEEAPS